MLSTSSPGRANQEAGRDPGSRRHQTLPADAASQCLHVKLMEVCEESSRGDKAGKMSGSIEIPLRDSDEVRTEI